MRAVDTNVLVRLVVGDDPEQVRAAVRFAASGAWASHLALAEAAWVLDVVHGPTAERIATALDTLLNYQDVTLQVPDVVGASLQQFMAAPALGLQGVDA